MDKINLRPMVKRGTYGETRITVDTREFDRQMDKAQDDIAKALWEGIGKALSSTKDSTANYLRGYAGFVPQAKRVADSLAYQRDVSVQGNEAEVEARFGSKGPTQYGEIGVGMHTDPDDNGNRYNIALALQEGRDAKYFRFKGNRSPYAKTQTGATQYGRQVGRFQSATAWYGHGGVGYFYGYPELDYLGKAEVYFESRGRSAIERAMKRRLE